MATIETLEVSSRFIPAGFEAGLQESVRQFQQFSARVASVGGPVILDVQARGIEQATRQVEAFTQAANPAALEGFSRATRAAETATTSAASASARLVEGMSQAGRAAAGAAEQQARLARTATAAVRGADSLRGALVTLTAQATGTNPAIAAVGQSLLLMGGGSAVVIGVAAGAALIAAAYNRITEGAREAAEAQQKLNDELDRGIAARNPLPGFADSAANLRTQLDSVEGQLARLRAQQGAVIFSSDARSGIVTRTEVDNTAEIKELEAERLAILGRNAELGARINEYLNNTPAARAMTRAAEEEARARERAAEAAERQRQAILDTQRALRIAQAGGGNLLQSGAVGESVFNPADFGIPDQIEIPIILRPALQREQGTGEGDEIQRMRANAEALNRLLAETGLRLEDVGNANFGGSVGAMQALAAEIIDVNRGLDSVVDAAVNVGAIGEEAARAIGEVQDLADAIAAVMTSASAGNVLGLIGAGVNIVGGILGGDDAHKRIVEENLRRIAENTAERRERFIGLGGAAEAAAFLAQLPRSLIEGASRAQAGGVVGRTGNSALEEFNKILRDANVSLADLQRIAEQHGLELLDEKGRLVAEAFERLRKEIIEAAEAAFGFNASLFEDQQTLLGLRSRALGLDQDPSAIFSQNLEAAGAVGAEVFEDFFGGIDLSDADAIRQASLDAIEAWESGAIDIEDLGGLTRDEFLEIIRSGLDAADAIDGMSEAAREAAQEFINVPLGFRQAQLAFEAQDPGAGLRPVDSPLVNVATRGTDGAALPALVSGLREDFARMRPTVNIDRIEVSGVNKTTREIFDDVLDEAERRSVAGGVTLRLDP